MSKMLLYSSIDGFFFMFELNELECDRCFFELCLLFCLTFSSRSIPFSLLIMLRGRLNKNFLTPLLQVIEENIFSLLTIIFIIILRCHPNVWTFIEKLNNRRRPRQRAAVCSSDENSFSFFQ
jgi:hypothetical protein